MSVYKTIDICLNLLLQIAKWSAIYCFMLVAGYILRLSTNWSVMDIYIGLVIFCLGFTWDRFWFAVRSGWNVKTVSLLCDYACLAASYRALYVLNGLSYELFWNYFIGAMFISVVLSVSKQRYITWLFVNERSLFKLFSYNSFEIDGRLIHVTEYELDGTLTTYMDVMETRNGSK